MSIIHDALKKVQEKSNSGSPWGAQQPPAEQQQPAEQLPPAKNMARSVLALIFSVVFILGAFVFLFKQVNTYFPNLKKSMLSSYYKLIHKQEPAAVKPVAAPLPPLARITVNPGQTQPTTLNVHGIMDEGANKLVLINNQVYQEGDEPVDGVKILKINLDSILINNDGKEETVRVNN